MPEIRLFAILKQVLDFVKKDYETQSNKENTVLYRLFSGNKIDDFDFYEQAVNLFTRGTDFQRKVEVHLFFNRQRANLPTVHISLPSESDQGAPNSLGMGIGDQAPIFGTVERKVTDTFNRKFDTNYNIVCTSDNPFEVILMYNLLRATLISLHAALSASGFENPKFSGADLQLNQDMMPGVFIRSFSINAFYNVEAPAFFAKALINDITVNGKAVNG